MNKTLIALVVCGSLIGTGCETLKKINSQNSNVGQVVSDYSGYIKPVVVAATTFIFGFNTSAADKIEKARIIHGYAVVLRKLSEGTTPTPQELEDALSNVTPGKNHWVVYVDMISSLYANLYSKTGGDVRVLAKVVNEIASALEVATLQYLPEDVTPAQLGFTIPSCSPCVSK